jgi:hypothetical protein
VALDFHRLMTGQRFHASGSQIAFDGLRPAFMSFDDALVNACRGVSQSL